MNLIETKDKSAPDRAFKIEPFRKHIRHTAPHRHKNYFEIIFLWKGDGVHLIDSSRYPIAPPVIFILKKDQLHGWDIGSEPEGYVMIVKDAFIEQLKDAELKLLFHLFWGIECLPLHHEADLIRLLFGALEQEALQTRPFRTEIIEGLMKSILGKLLQNQPFFQADSRYLGLYTSLVNLLGGEALLSRRLQDVANQLGVSLPALNEACRKTAGQTAKQIMDEHTMKQARRYLRFTTLTISEIAYALHFNDPSYFIKFFRKHAGLTPEEYRKEG